MIGLIAQSDLAFSFECQFRNESVDKFSRTIIPMCRIDRDVIKERVRFDWPVDLRNFWISSLFGPRRHQGVVKHHDGVDMAALKGTAVKVAAPGRVSLIVRGHSGYGNRIEIKHKHGLMTRYAHLDEIFVRKGKRVKRGDCIGTVGATGHVRGKRDPSHLHFEVLKKERRVFKHKNPLPYLYCFKNA